MDNLLLENFYTVLESEFSPENENNFNVKIRLNPKHAIYKGHFEQIPITPGVCQVQIIKELLIQKFQKNLILEDGDSIKYLGMINPETNADLTVSLNVTPAPEAFAVTASIAFEKTIFTKFKGKFRCL